MVYCSHCGANLDDEAYFCSKCGTKTEKGKAAKTPYPADEFSEAMYNVGVELERAFTIAAHETHAAFKKVRDEIQKNTAKTAEAGNVCPKCGTNNPQGAVFCHSCGAKLAVEAGST
jgi:ribosomal protein L40E